MNKFKLLLATLIFCIIIPVPHVAAGFTISIEGNGSGADNQVNIGNNSNTSVQQSNQSSVANNVETNLNTGDNQASGNQGEVSIETGDANQNIVIENQSNINAVETSSGQIGEVDANISGNGNDSNNQIAITTSNQTNINTQNQAVITNTITTRANTGGNQANHNQGDVSIETGDIQVLVVISNQANVNYVKAGVVSPVIHAKIAGNGSNSVNQIIGNEEYVQAIYQANSALIENNLDIDNNTGKNQANDNQGEVDITTGDVETVITTETKVNENVIETGKVKPCDDDNPDKPGDEDDDDGDDNPDIPPVTPPSSGGNGSNNNGNGSSGNGSSGGDSNGVGGPSGNGQVLGTTDILPKTGSLSNLLLLISNFLMLLLGCYLRLRSGRAPAYAYAY